MLDMATQHYNRKQYQARGASYKYVQQVMELLGIALLSGVTDTTALRWVTLASLSTEAT